jgi:hypothetical protein
MKVEITEDILRHEDVENSKLYDLVKGDIITVPDEVGHYFLACGWAKDVDGQVEAAARNTNPVQLSPKNGNHSLKAPEVGKNG